ncbi:recombination protein NinB (plasmid) [Escherichia coli]|nr:recombination protein NinB [Escherichia coli]
MKQIYMLRNEAIRNNAIDAILSLPIDDKSPHEVHIKEPKRSNPQNRLMGVIAGRITSGALAWTETCAGGLERPVHCPVA